MSSTTWTIEKKLCRCCHSEGEFKNLAELCFDAGSEESYVDMIKHCFFINIIPIPGLLSIATFTICESCITHVKDAVRFRKQVEACEDKFLNFYSRNAIKVERPIVATIEIKEEEIDSCNDDDFSAADDRRDNFHELSECGLEKLADKSDSDGLEELEFEEIVQEKPTKVQSKTTKAANKEKKKTGRPKKTKGDQEESQSQEDSEKITDKSDGLEELKFERIVQEKPTKAQSKTTKAANKEKKKTGRSKKTKGDQEESQSQEDSEKISRGTYYTITQNRHSCNDCHRSFASQPLVSQHYRFVHLKKRPRERKCPKCDEKIPGYLRAYHLENKHGIPAPTCGVCSKKFRFPCHVLEHQKKVHMGEKTVSCDICQKSFFNKLSLRLHMSLHSSEKKFKCEICERVFRWENNLKDHIKIHTGDKRFACRVCKKAFVQKSTLKQHTIRNHPGFEIQ